MSDPASPAPVGPLNTVSLRLRVTATVVIVLACALILLSVAVNAIFVAQSNQNLEALLTGRAQLARQLARTGVGAQQIVNRVDADGVQAYLVLRTLAIDVALVTDARQTLRRVLLITGLAVLLVSALLVAAAVRFALRPLDAMAALAKTITEGNRGRWLNPTRTDTEIGQTARAFDEMVDELEGAEIRARQAEERTRAFLADAAHELRTPITGVQAAAETLLQHGDQLSAADRETCRPC